MRRKETEESRVTYSNQKGRDTLNVKWQVSNMPRSHHTTSKVVTSLSCSHYIPFRLVFVSPAVIWRSHTTGPIGANTGSRPGDVTRKRRRQNLWKVKEKSNRVRERIRKSRQQGFFYPLKSYNCLLVLWLNTDDMDTISKSLCVFILNEIIIYLLYLLHTNGCRTEFREPLRQRREGERMLKGLYFYSVSCLLTTQSTLQHFTFTHSHIGATTIFTMGLH